MRLFSKGHFSSQVLTEYLDDYLTPAKREKVEVHLASCGHCRQELDSLRVTVNSLRRMFQAQPRRSFVLLNAPEMTPYTPPAKPRVPSWAVGLATSAAVLALVSLVSVDVLGSLSTSDDNPIDTATLPRDTTASPEVYRNFTDKSTSNTGFGSTGSSPEATVPSKQRGAAPGVTEIITTNSPSAEPAARETASVSESVDIVVNRVSQAPGVIDTSSPSNDGDTSIYWRIFEAMLAAGAAVLAILLFKRWRNRSSIQL